MHWVLIVVMTTPSGHHGRIQAQPHTERFASEETCIRGLETFREMARIANPDITLTGTCRPL